MARNRRISVFLNDDEYNLIRLSQEDDVSLGAHVRRLAINRATWLAEAGHKQRGKRAELHTNLSPNTAYGTPANTGELYSSHELGEEPQG